MIDTHSLKASIDIVQLIERDLGPGIQNGRWTNWRCPFHSDGNTPSLSATSDDGRWHCFGCNKGGDVIDWMTQYHGLSFLEACRELSKGLRPSLQASAKPKHFTQTLNVGQNSIFQQSAADFIQVSHSYLLQQNEVIQYLLSRGLHRETLSLWQLGYNPNARHDTAHKWGLDNRRYPKGVWLPRGWTIPCKVRGVYHAIKIRRPDTDIQYGQEHNWLNSPKYINVAGSSSRSLFGADFLRAELSTLLIVEGEFNAMIAYQELHDRLDVVSIGSASNRIPDEWLPTLSRYDTVLALYDADNAGEHGLTRIEQQLPAIHPVALPSDTGDLNDFYVLGGDLNGWLTHRLQRIAKEQNQAPHSPYSKHSGIMNACKEENRVYVI